MMTATTIESPKVGPSPVMPIGRVLGTYLIAAKLETRAALRNVGMAVPFLVLPPTMYLLFGVVIIGAETGSDQFGNEHGPEIVNYLFAGFCTMGAMMPGIFGGAMIALERENGLLKLKRALPMPPGAHLLAKVAMAMLFSTVAVGATTAVALVAGSITLSGSQIVILGAVLIVGSIPFCAIGLLIGSISSAAAVPAYGNLVFLPMIYLSGLFVPLPDFLERWVLIWPAFYLDQLALGLAGLERFSFVPPLYAGVVLAGITVVCGGLAIRRLARVG